MSCQLCGALFPPCTRSDCPHRAGPDVFPFLSLDVLGPTSPGSPSFFADLPSLPLPSLDTTVPQPMDGVEKKVEQTEWYSDEVMNLLFRHYAAQAGNGVSTVPAVLGSDNTLGINFLQTFLTHHLLDHPERKPIVIPVNLGERHWVGVLIQFMPDGSVVVTCFDSLSPLGDAQVETAVCAALGLAGFNAVQVFQATGEAVQRDGYNCGPWVVEWLRFLLGLTSWQTLPEMGAARTQHRGVTGVQAALQRDLEARKWWGFDFGPQFDARSTLEALVSEDVWRRFLLPLGGPETLGGSSGLLGATQKLISGGHLPLGLLYKRFLNDRDAKQLAEHLFRARIARIDARYRSAKAAFLEALGMAVDEKTRAPRPWNDKAPRLAFGVAPQKPYERLKIDLVTDRLLELGPFRCCDLSPSLTLIDLTQAAQVDWMALSVMLTVLRKRLARTWQERKESLVHVTVVALPGGGTSAPCFWALNSKDERGNGTTRILLPLTEEPYEKPVPGIQVRVLDLTYEQIADLTVEGTAEPSEIHASLEGLIAAISGDSPGALGQIFLDLMSASPEVQKACREKLETQGSKLDRMHCVLLRSHTPGGRVQLGTLDLGHGTVPCPVFEGLLRTVHAPKTGLGKKILNLPLSALQLAYYFLGIVVAETRHARGVYVSTLDLLELVQMGFVPPQALFTDLDGQIEHGWLLPGANFLGGVLAQDLKRLAMPLVGSVTRDTTPLDGLPDVQRAVQGELMERRWDGEITSLDDPSHPVYQVLQKCLFITLLRFLAKCPSDAGKLLVDVRGEPDPAHRWPPGHDLANASVSSSLEPSAKGTPDLEDLSELLFGQDAWRDCEPLMQRARKLFSGTDLQIFCSLFRIQITLYVWREGDWRSLPVFPAEGTTHTSTIKRDVLAKLSLVAYGNGWRVLVPRAQRAEDFLAELGRTYVQASTGDFEELVEKIEKEEASDDSEEEYEDDGSGYSSS